MENWKCILVGFLTKNNDEVNLNIEFNDDLFPGIDTNSEEFLTAFYKLTTPIIGTTLELQGAEHNAYNCSDMPYLAILVNEDDENRVYKLALNSYYTRAFVEDVTLIDSLTKSNMGVSIIEFGNIFSFLANYNEKQTVSEIEIKNFNGNLLYELAVGFCEGKLRSDVVFNHDLYIGEKQTQEQFEVKLAETDVARAMNDIGTVFQAFLTGNKEAFPDNEKAIILMVNILDKDGAKVSIDVKVVSENKDVIAKINDIMIQHEMKEAIRYVNSQLINLIQ